MALKETPHETGASYENAPEIGQFDQREQRVSKELVADDRSLLSCGVRQRRSLSSLGVLGTIEAIRATIRLPD